MPVTIIVSDYRERRFGEWRKRPRDIIPIWAKFLLMALAIGLEAFGFHSKWCLCTGFLLMAILYLVMTLEGIRTLRYLDWLHGRIDANEKLYDEMEAEMEKRMEENV